ncbi:hypothetical protein Stok01_01807 [Sulfurisphaera tokodaii]
MSLYLPFSFQYPGGLGLNQLGSFPSFFISINAKKLLQSSAFFLATCPAFTLSTVLYFEYTVFSEPLKSTLSPSLNCCILNQFTSFQHFAVVIANSFSLSWVCLSTCSLTTLVLFTLFRPLFFNVLLYRLAGYVTCGRYEVASSPELPVSSFLQLWELLED